MNPSTKEKLENLARSLPETQGIFRRHEIPIADHLMSFKEDLTKEFLAYHTDFIDGEFSKGVPYWNPVVDVDQIKTNKASWKVSSVKYNFAPVIEKSKKDFSIITDEIKSRFPTATRLTEEFGEDCPISTYSILESNSVIKRHTGIENRTGEYIRIHIPLIVPPGEIFFEVNGEEINWSDIFAFDNQQVHSAYNNTPYRRLVYMIDIKRSRVGLPPGLPYNPLKEHYAKPFIRNGVQLT